jgi:osmotically-inducible protein OsmY
MRKAAVILISILQLLAQAAAAGEAAKNSTTKPNSSDGEIERDIRARFAKSKISTNNFQVKVQNGVATLTGKTGVIQHKGVATRLAKLGGARSVNNKIEVSEEAKRKASENLSTGRRRAQSERGEPRSDPRSNSSPAKQLAPTSDSHASPSESTPGRVRRAVVRWPK